MASSSTYAFFHCHYAFQKFPLFCVILCVLHALQNATESHSASFNGSISVNIFNGSISVNIFFSWISSIFVGFFRISRFFYVTLYFVLFHCQQWMHERASLLSYTYIACLVYVRVQFFVSVKVHIAFLDSCRRRWILAFRRNILPPSSGCELKVECAIPQCTHDSLASLHSCGRVDL